MRIRIGATAAKVAFGGGGEPRPIVIEPWAPCCKPEDPHNHIWEECDFGRYYRCWACGEERPIAASIYSGVYQNVVLHKGPKPCHPAADRHHRSCALRSGGNSCTC